jgi:hypothetical protein
MRRRSCIYVGASNINYLIYVGQLFDTKYMTVINDVLSTLFQYIKHILMIILRIFIVSSS